MLPKSIQEAPTPACRACAGELSFSFEVEVLGDTPAKYHKCRSCGSLMVLEPHWLERSYQTTLFPDPDTGALYRTLYVNRYIRRMRAVGLLPRRYRSLDYGSGLGMLVSLQLDRKADAHGFDQYSVPRFAQLACGKQLPNGPFDLISAIEVIEHLLDPIDVLRAFQSRLAPSGLVLISTELYQRERWPDPSSWHYVDRQHGQHIMLFTRAGLKAAAKAAGLRHVYTVNKGKTPFMHVFVHEHRMTPLIRLGFLVWQHLWGELRESLDLAI
ncbi:MAG: class I SAM-dependent methyltransferase [Pseudomonadota bacterium]